MDRIKVCIVSLGAYPLLAEQDAELVGGAELQSVLLAKELTRRDFHVSFIVMDHGQKSPQTIEGVEVIKAYTADTPMGIRFSLVQHIWRALRQADADIYYGFRGIAGIVTVFCMLKRRKLVIGIPSDLEVERERAIGSNIYNWLWRFDLKMAKRVISQTKYQQEMLKTRFGRDSVIIKAFHELENKLIEKAMPPIVLWVSTIRPEWKHPELFLKLASAIPEARFQMVGGPSREKEFYEEIAEKVKKIPNLDFVGFVPHHEVGDYFEKASIFVNTSDVEGFPNTYLEAWSHYTPVVSINIDPDEIICEHTLGFHSETFQQMVKDVRLLLEDGELRRQMAENGRSYVEQEHDAEKIVGEYVELFDEVMGKD